MVGGAVTVGVSFNPDTSTVLVVIGPRLVIVVHARHMGIMKNIGHNLTIKDKDLYYRIVRILRIEQKETCILFNKNVSVDFCVQNNLGKNQIEGVIKKIEQNTPLHPHITFLLPILKKDNCDTALYSLTEIGVNTIQLVTTQKTQRKWTHERDMQRAIKIIITAAEQSKNFAFANLQTPKPFEEYIKNIPENNYKIFFDPTGISLFTHLEITKPKKPVHITLMIGPEGDLTQEEKNLLKQSNFTFCSLTPTILRASQAAAVSMGIIRSYFR